MSMGLQTDQKYAGKKNLYLEFTLVIYLKESWRNFSWISFQAPATLQDTEISRIQNLFWSVQLRSLPPFNLFIKLNPDFYEFPS